MTHRANPGAGDAITICQPLFPVPDAPAVFFTLMWARVTHAVIKKHLFELGLNTSAAGLAALLYRECAGGTSRLCAGTGATSSLAEGTSTAAPDSARASRRNQGVSRWFGQSLEPEPNH